MIELKWIVFELNWIRFNWIGLDWTELIELNELSWYDLNWIEFIELDWMNGIQLNWIESLGLSGELIELKWNEFNWLNWIEFSWIELNSVELNWIELNWVSGALWGSLGIPWGSPGGIFGSSMNLIWKSAVIIYIYIAKRDFEHQRWHYNVCFINIGQNKLLWLQCSGMGDLRSAATARWFLADVYKTSVLTTFGGGSTASAAA